MNGLLGSTPPVYSLFILFLIIAANYIGELFPCRVQTLLSSNIYLKHFVAFLTLLFFVVLTDPFQKYVFMKILKDSILLYIIFLMFINTNRFFYLLCLIVSGILYIIILIKKQYITQKEEKEKNIKDFKDTKEAKDIDDNLDIINKLYNVFLIVFIIILVLGFIIYIGEKKIEYKNKFNYITFIFGKPSCKHNSPNVNLRYAFKSAFK